MEGSGKHEKENTVKILDVVTEKLKQRIKALAANFRRYQERVDRFRKSRIFQNNKKQFYKEINQKGEGCDNDHPDAEESKKCWGNIWSQLVDHNRDAKWLKDLQSENNVTKQEKVDTTQANLKKMLGRVPNQKSQGPDLVQGFCLKNFSSLHGRVRSQLKECKYSGLGPSWLTKGRTSLLQKDKNKGNITSNYRPITCLPLMRKLLPGVIGHLDQQKLFQEKKKGCRNRSRGTNDLLYIDQRSQVQEK